jgi:mRNA interferase MazF
MKRGEIWWVRQPASFSQASDCAKKRRPYLIVSADPWNLVETYPRVTVCPLTGAENVTRRYDTDVLFKKKETGLSKDSVVRCVEIYTIFRSNLIERIGSIPKSRLAEIDRALSLYLGILKIES